jgi:anti-anti-sigma regulatory factor
MPFKSEKKEGVLIIHCPADIEEVDVKLFKIQSKAWVNETCQSICFDFTETESILQTFMREVVQFQKDVLTAGKKLSSVGMRPGTKKAIEDCGLLRVFNPA